MKLKITNELKGKLIALVSKLIMIQFTGKIDFPTEFADALRGLADEIDLQNKRDA